MEAKIIQKYQKRTHPWLLAKATEVFNAFIRKRNSDDEGNFTCIACGIFKPKAQFEAGHYFPAGQYGQLRYNRDNVHGECIHCNYYSGDHLLKFRANLIIKLGEETLHPDRPSSALRFLLIEKNSSPPYILANIDGIEYKR